MNNSSKKKIRPIVAIIALVIMSFLALMLALSLGSTGFRLGEFFRLLFGEAQSGTAGVIVGIRLPRALLSYLVGGALAVSGCCLQGVFKNHMADSHILGVSSGAGLGAALAITLNLGATAFKIGGVAVWALVGGLGAMALVHSIARVGRRSGAGALLLSGVAVSSMLGALTSAIMLIDRTNTDKILLWTLGSFNAATFEKVSFAALTILPASALCLLFARPLNIMLLGEEDSRLLGVDYNRVTRVLMLLTTVITASAVSVSGVIGFVGLMLPHIVRLLTGPDHRLLMPCSFLGGGIFLCTMDMLSRSLFPPLELPVGVLCAMCGVPFFLYLLRKRGGTQA